jgi:hypothetical protein
MTMTTETAPAPAPAAAPVPPTTITIDQATQLGLAIHQQLHRPNLGAVGTLGFAKSEFAQFAKSRDVDDDATRAAVLATPFEYFVSVGLLTPAQAKALTAVLLGRAAPDTLPPADPTAPSVYQILRLAVLHGVSQVTFGFWDFISDLAEVVAGAALGFIAAGPPGAVAGGALAVMDVLDH